MSEYVQVGFCHPAEHLMVQHGCVCAPDYLLYTSTATLGILHIWISLIPRNRR
jgi:hypothetical protein